MVNALDERLMNEAFAVVLKNIDLDAFGKKVAPAVAAAMQRSIMAALKELDWDDWVGEVCYDDRVKKVVADKILAAFKGDK